MIPDDIGQFAGVPLSTFYAEYWRRRPLFVKGGARLVMDRLYTKAEFASICAELATLEDPRVQELPCGTIFAQHLDRKAPELREVAQRYQSIWRGRNFWFDGTLAQPRHGLGSHYDTSDNFVMQQSGTKRWRLHSPEALGRKKLRDRLLSVNPGACIGMPEDPLEFVLEPGDMLYIPLLWIHDGVSCGESLSLTMAFNLEIPLDVLLRDLKRRLTIEDIWWLPAPMMPLGQPDTRETEGLDSRLDRYFEDLLDILAKPAFREDVKRLWRNRMIGD